MLKGGVIDRLDVLMEALIEQDVVLQQKCEILESCSSVGKKSAMMILAEDPELGTLNRKEIASLAGLAPINRDSGMVQGKRFIQKGRKHL
jgi:transposase